MALDLNAAMDGLGVRLATISGLEVKDYNADAVYPPAAVITLPEIIEYDESMGRGTDRCTIPVWVFVGKISERSARDALAAYMSGTGSSSIKSAIEADSDLAGAAHTCRVMTAEPIAATVGGVEYLAAIFNVEVVA